MDMELASIEAYFIKKKKKELTTSNAKEESGEKKWDGKKYSRTFIL